MKKIILIITLALSLCGCKDTKSNSDNNSTTNFVYTSDRTNVIFKTDFNKESYVWESFIFSTNRVDKK